VQALDNNFAGSTFAAEGSFNFNYNPAILFVRDIPNDQGGQVRVSWSKSGLDDPVSPTPIVSYGVWRKIRPEFGRENTQEGNKVTDPEEKTTCEFANDSLGFYDFIAAVPAVQALQYNYVAPTLEDSSASGIPYFTFLVTAHTAVPSVFFTSYPDSGYSVDNLSPAAPRNLAGSFTNGAVSLNWHTNSESDLRNYLLYRSLTPNIDPSTDTSFASTTDTSFVDSNPPAGGFVYYIVCAQDIHDNISEASNEVTVAISGIFRTSNEVPTTYNLYQNYPNPFNPHTTVQFDLPQSCHAIIRIYNSLGAQVATLVDESLPAGKYRFFWTPRQLASGIYFYTIQAGDYKSVKKMILMK
jgi:hypothetical protein